MKKDRRWFLKDALLAAPVATLELPNPRQKPTENTAGIQRPNVVLILSDDQGMADVGCYGHSKIPTPNIDSIAAEGLRMTQFYVSAPVCTPSRFSLLTGMLPNRSRDRLLGALMYAGEGDANRGIRPGEITLASLLRGVGYATGIIGKWHLGHGDPSFLPIQHGFDNFVGHTGGCIDYWKFSYGNRPDWYLNDQNTLAEGYATDVIAEEADRWIRRHRDRPFFLYVPFNAPHYAKAWDEEKHSFSNDLQAPEELLKRFAWIDDPKRRAYAAMVWSLDLGVGRILRSLDANNLRKNTLVMFISDNGGDPNYGGSNRPFRGTKGTHFEGGVRVPCVMRFPGWIPAGTTCHQVGSALDIVPTLSSLVGFPPPNQPVDGVDLSHALSRGLVQDRELFFASPNRGAALRQGRWKMISIPARSDGSSFLKVPRVST